MKDAELLEIIRKARATSEFAAVGERGPAVREQRRLGVRGASGSTGRRGGPLGLIRREMDVAVLIVDGHTNQQIAERLFASPRMVETHISHLTSAV